MKYDIKHSSIYRVTIIETDVWIGNTFNGELNINKLLLNSKFNGIDYTIKLPYFIWKRHSLYTKMIEEILG